MTNSKTFNIDNSFDDNFENLNAKLNDEDFLKQYKTKYDNYKVDTIPKVIGWLLVKSGNIVYGREPSYIKFRAVEVIARVPYQSWTSAAYTLLTIFYTREEIALNLAQSKLFARHANDNETMHVITLSKIVEDEHKQSNKLLHTIIPMLFAFVYFWISYILYLLNKKWSYQINYLFEDHAFHQYDTFIKRYSNILKNKPLNNKFLKWYGRDFDNQYDYLISIRNDELIHRNISIEEIEKCYCPISE
jgi:ubiquinol oxidase